MNRLAVVLREKTNPLRRHAAAHTERGMNKSARPIPDLATKEDSLRRPFAEVVVDANVAAVEHDVGDRIADNPAVLSAIDRAHGVFTLAEPGSRALDDSVRSCCQVLEAVKA